MSRTTVAFILLVVLSMACQGQASMERLGLLTIKSTSLPTTVPTTSTTVAKPSDNSHVTVVLKVEAEKFLNLRDRPDASGPLPSAVIGRMAHGTQVTWLNECQNGWAKVRWKGMTGWAKNELLRPVVCKK